QGRPLSLAFRDRAGAGPRGDRSSPRGGAGRRARARPQVAGGALDARVPGPASCGLRGRRTQNRGTHARRCTRLMAERHYTVEQANAALEWVRERIDRLRTARVGLNDEEAREALQEAGPTNGGGEPGRVVSDAFLEMRNALTELQAMEVVLRDLDRGLVDFPSMRDGREVFLCWEEGEEEIGFWHDLDSGYGGRNPLRKRQATAPGAREAEPG